MSFHPEASQLADCVPIAQGVWEGGFTSMAGEERTVHEILYWRAGLDGN